MEFNLSSREKAHQIVSSSDDISGHVRSYTCTFCKRGFSNAQALGGHMNIHRKDRAKLKEFPETLVSPSDDSSSQVESSEEKSGSPKTTWVFSKEDDYHQHEVSRGKDGGVGEVKQLCLFTDHKQISSRNYVEIKSKGLSHGSSSHEELDLELRLGLEHHER